MNKVSANYQLNPNQSIKTKSNAKTKYGDKLVNTAIATTIGGAIGSLNGVYRKIEDTVYNSEVDFKDKFIKNPKDKTVYAMAITKPVTIENKDVNIVLEFYEKHNKKRLVIGQNETIESISKFKNGKFKAFADRLVQNGFDSKNGNLMDFLSKIDIDKFNSIDNSSGIKINFTDNKGQNLVQFLNDKYHKIVNQKWKLLPSQIEGVQLLEKGFEDIVINEEIRKTNKVTVTNFKKITNPIDEKCFNAIEKIPFGKKIVEFFQKTNSPIKQIKIKPLNNLFYNKTSMLKGVGVFAMLGAITYRIASKIIGTKEQKNNQT